MDRLSTLLSQFGVRANLFYNGKLVRPGVLRWR